MASKIKVMPPKEEMLEKEGPETQSDRPLLDLSAIAVKELIRKAKKCGYVTHDQIDALLSSEEVKSEQIARLSGSSSSPFESQLGRVEDRRRFWLEKAVDAAALHEVDADQSGESERAADERLRGLCEPQQ